MPVTNLLMATRIQRFLFAFSAKMPPALWILATFAILAALQWTLLFSPQARHIAHGPQYFSACILPLFWLGLGRMYIPSPKAKAVILRAESRRHVSLHLKGGIPQAANMREALQRAMALCQAEGIDAIELRSAIFGKPAKERAWLSEIRRQAAAFDESLSVEVVDRVPLTPYESLRYRLGNPSHNQHAVSMGAGFKASRILISGLASGHNGLR